MIRINSQFNTYSTEEQKIGSWVDGKTLYRKVMYFNTEISSAYNNKIEHNINNVDFIRIKEAHLYYPSKGYSLPLPITLYSSNTTFDNLSVRVDKNYVTFLSEGTWSTGWYKIVILEYTKTTG